jgi:outer membrane protein TolC
VIQANAARNVAEIQLNRILNRPLEEKFDVQEADIHDVVFMKRQERLKHYWDNPRSFKIFRAFMVEEGFANSPELKRLDAAMRAQRRLLQSTEYAFWVPTIALFGDYIHRFAESGAGSNGGLSTSLPPELDLGITEMDDSDWSVGFNLSFPLYEGSAKFAEKEQAAQELLQLELEKQSVADRIEQRIRTSLHIAGASFAAIEQLQLARETAFKNLDLVITSYSQGAVSIIELIDAQNAALVADLSASNAVYDFLIDVMEMERAVGKFDIFRSDEERELFFNRLDAYFDYATANNTYE